MEVVMHQGGAPMWTHHATTSMGQIASYLAILESHVTWCALSPWNKGKSVRSSQNRREKMRKTSQIKLLRAKQVRNSKISNASHVLYIVIILSQLGFQWAQLEVSQRYCFASSLFVPVKHAACLIHGQRFVLETLQYKGIDYLGKLKAKN